MENQFQNAVKKAYENNELSLLLGGDNKYIFDANNQLILASDLKLIGGNLDEIDPINFEALISAMEIFYCGLDKKSGQKKNYIDNLVESIKTLLNSEDAIKIYFATKIYFVIGNRAAKDIFYPLKGVDVLIKPLLISTLNNSITNLKNTKIYEGTQSENGLLDVLAFYNSKSTENIRIDCLEEY